MSKCPTCHRAVRRKKVETREEALKRIDRQGVASVGKRLNAPRPRGTRYRD